MNSAVVRPPISMAPEPTFAEVEAVYKKITRKLIPLLFICYMLNCVDRANIGYTQLQMKDSLGFSDAVYGLAAGIFFIGYFLFEVPSNLLLHKIGARKTILRIMVLWGLVSAGTMFVKTAEQFYLARFLLGVFEAGFFPGVLLFLTFWYPGERRAKVVSWFMLATLASAVITGPVSGWIMKNMHGWQGYEGWQWTFLIEGLPTVLLGFIVYFVLADGPAQARWLTPAERKIVQHALSNGDAEDRSSHASGLRIALRDPNVYKLSLIGFCALFGIYFLSFWLPTMIKELGVDDIQKIGLYSIIPNIFGAIVMVLYSRSSDRRAERRWHYASAVAVGIVGLLLTVVFNQSLSGSLVALSITACGVMSALPLFWAISTSCLSKDAAPAGIAFINCMASLAGVISPAAVGWIKTQTGSVVMGLYLSTAFAAIGLLLMVFGIRPALYAVKPSFKSGLNEH